jgi:hypothetical protein
MRAFATAALLLGPTAVRSRGLPGMTTLLSDCDD